MLQCCSIYYQRDLIGSKTIWIPAIAVSGLVFDTGNRFPNWQGNLFAGGLVGKNIRRLEVDKIDFYPCSPIKITANRNGNYYGNPEDF